MLNVLRKQAQSTLIQGMVLMIAVVFIFWGVGSNLNNNRNAVATVNGVEISYRDYQRSYDSAVENFRAQLGGQTLPKGLLEQMGIKRQVVLQLIQAELIRQGGSEMGIVVSDIVPQREIEEMEAFQQNGQFNIDQYKAVLGQNRMTPTSFEDGLKSDLQTQRVTGDIGSFAMVSDQAVQDWLAFADEEIKLAYVAFESTAFEDKVEVVDNDLTAWFDINKEQYRSDPKVQLKYLFFNVRDDEGQVTPSEEKLRARYESEKAGFAQPEQRHARHILFKVAEGDADTVRAEQRTKAEEVLVLARQGDDFAGLAETYSEGPTKERGGDLGFFPSGRMVPAFDEVVFFMQEGDISGLVETQFGFHIIKLEEIRPASTRSFDQVKDNLAVAIKKQGARGHTFTRATSAYKAIMMAGSLDKYGETGDGEVITTEYFTRSNPQAGVTGDPTFLAEAFKLNKGELSSIVELTEGYAIIFVSDIQQPELPELEAVRDLVVVDYTKEKAVELSGKAADELLAASREKNGLAEAVTAEQQVQTTDFLKRSGPAASEALPNQVIQDGFKLAWKDKLPEDVVKVGNSSYVFEVTDRRAGAGESDAARLAQVREQLLATVRTGLMTSWLSRVQKQADIWTNDTLLQ